MAAHYYTVTWDQLHRDARALAWRLMGIGRSHGIVAISRGGLIPAAIIARELDLRLVESVCVITYQDEPRGEPLVTKPPVAAGDGTGFLIVDDLVDLGTTARVVRALLPKAYFACVYAKPAGARRWTASSPKCPRTPGYCFPGTPNRSSSSRWRAAAGCSRVCRLAWRRAFRSAVGILQPHDVVLPQIGAGLDLDQGQRDLAGVFQAVDAAQRQIDAFVLAHDQRFVVARHPGGAVHHDPVFGAMEMALQRQLPARV